LTFVRQSLIYKTDYKAEAAAELMAPRRLRCDHEATLPAVAAIAPTATAIAATAAAAAAAASATAAAAASATAAAAASEAAATAAAAAAAAAAKAAAAAAATAARCTLTRFVDGQVAPVEFLPVKRIDRRLRLRIPGDLDETEPAGLARHSIRHHLNADWLDPRSLERTTNAVLRRVEGQVSHVQSLAHLY
jgi:hypothetical protein